MSKIERATRQAFRRTPGNPGSRITADGVEYAIYIHHPANDDRRACSWERAATMNCRNAAVREAQKLYRSRKYSKVEIKRSMFDRTRNRRQGDTMLVFGAEPKLRAFRALSQAAIYVALALLAAALMLALYVPA